MKIIHLIYDHIKNPWVGGGGAVRAYEICRRLAEKHDVTLLCGRYPGAEDYDDGRLKVRFVGSGSGSYVVSTFSYAASAASYLMRHGNGADVVVEDFAPYNPVFSRFLSGGAANALILHHREGMNLFKRYSVLGLPFMLAEKIYPKLYRNIICVSRASAEKFGLKNATVISNGIDSSLLDVEPAEGPYAAYIGRLHLHNKGLDTLVEALRQCDVHLQTAGRGRDEDAFRKMLDEAGLSGRVEMKGFLSEEDKVPFLSSASFVVVPSRYEGQGIVVLEAAALGKPVIVSDIPELGYAVTAGFGLSFRTGDAADLAFKMRELAGDVGLRRRMSQRAREFARGITWEKVTEETEEFLKGIVSSGGAG